MTNEVVSLTVWYSSQVLCSKSIKKFNLWKEASKWLSYGNEVNKLPGTLANRLQGVWRLHIVNARIRQRRIGPSPPIRNSRNQCRDQIAGEKARNLAKLTKDHWPDKEMDLLHREAKKFQFSELAFHRRLLMDIYNEKWDQSTNVNMQTVLTIHSLIEK